MTNMLGSSHMQDHCSSRCVNARIDRNNYTDVMSDHYPVLTSWIYNRTKTRNDCECDDNNNISLNKFNLF